MLKKYSLQISVIASTVFALLLNFLAIAIPLNGLSTQQLADNYPVYFVPANYVFSIWGIIYIGLIAFSIYQLLPKVQENETIKKLRKPVIVSNILNGLWIIFWHYQLLPLATITMLAMLVTLLYIYIKLPAWNENVGLWFRLTTLLTFSVYIGWISVATISNISVQLYSLNWSGLGISGEYWAALMCLIAADLAINLIWSRKDYPFALVTVWATVGIFVKFMDKPALAVTALIATGIVSLAILLSLYRQLMRRIRRNAVVESASAAVIEASEVSSTSTESNENPIEAEIITAEELPKSETEILVVEENPSSTEIKTEETIQATEVSETAETKVEENSKSEA